MLKPPRGKKDQPGVLRPGRPGRPGARNFLITEEGKLQEAAQVAPPSHWKSLVLPCTGGQAVGQPTSKFNPFQSFQGSMNEVEAAPVPDTPANSINRQCKICRSTMFTLFPWDKSTWIIPASEDGCQRPSTTQGRGGYNPLIIRFYNFICIYNPNQLLGC